MGKILYYNTDGTAAPAPLAGMAALFNALAADYGFDLGDITVVFMNDEELLEMNRQALGHDYYTDVITYDYTEGKTLSGELYISTERIAENATEYGATYEEELARVMIHGVLHLAGHKDENAASKKEMTDREDYYLRLLSVPRGTTQP